jgi:Uncharacterised nucleotidyltransferase
MPSLSASHRAEYMPHPADNLSQSLLVLALSAPDSKSAASAIRLLAVADQQAWQLCLARLQEHHLLPLVWYGLVHHDQVKKIPAPIAGTLQMHFERAQVINTVSLDALRGVANAASNRGVFVTVCKGIVLASHYYPEPGARPMNDIDLWIQPQERAACAEAMREIGFVRNETKSSAGADLFENGMGIVFDVHVKMDLFASQPNGMFSLTRAASEGPWRVFEPHALLAHLVVHMSSHARKIGPMLLWLVDLWFVMRKVWLELDPSRLRQLLPSMSEWILLLRTIRMFELLADEPAPSVLAPFIAGVSPADLRALWRERRLATWGLPRPKGWARLVACRLGLRDSDSRYYPSPEDLVLWPIDRLEAWLAIEKARRSGRVT